MRYMRYMKLIYTIAMLSILIFQLLLIIFGDNSLFHVGFTCGLWCGGMIGLYFNGLNKDEKGEKIKWNKK